MKAFVTGGTGFAGSHLVEHLLNTHNAEVFALIRDLNKLKWLEGLRIHPLHGDLYHIPDLPRDLDYVFHLAGLTKAYKSANYYTVNQKGTASLFHSLDKQGIRPRKIVYLSSLAASGPSHGGRPVLEDATPSPVTIYGNSKLQGEAEALKYKQTLPLIIIRVAAVYGPRDRDFLKYFRAINRGILPVLGLKKRMLHLCYVKDLSRALVMSAQSKWEKGEVFHIAHPHPCSWDEIGRTAGQILGKKLMTIKIPLPLIYKASAISDFVSLFTRKRSIINRQKFKEFRQDGWLADTHKAQEKLGFNPTFALEEGLNETLSWYTEKGWL